MSVLITVPRLHRAGGVTHYFRALRPHLDSDVRYLEIGAEASEAGGIVSVKRALADYWRFHRRLSEEAYALVHLNPSLLPRAMVRDLVFLAIARMHSVPVLVFFRGWDVRVQEFVRKWLAGPFRYVLNKTAGVVVLAEQFRRQLDSLGVAVPLFRVTTCVNDAIFTSQTAGNRAGPRLNILYLSRLDRGKGVLEAIEAFGILKMSLPDAALTIAGDGSERNRAQQLVAERDIRDVRFTGYVRDHEKERLFLDADIFFFPTFFGEGMPNAVLEALAYGLPVVTRMVGGLQDFFEQERMGFITDSEDPADFAGLLDRLARNHELRDRIAQYNRSYAQEHFAASRVAKRLEEIYAQVAGKNRLDQKALHPGESPH